MEYNTHLLPQSKGEVEYIYVYCWPRNFFFFFGGGEDGEENWPGGDSQGSIPHCIVALIAGATQAWLWCAISCHWRCAAWTLGSANTLGVCLNGWFGMFYDECTFKGCLFEGNPLHGPLILPFFFLYVSLPFLSLPSPPVLTSPLILSSLFLPSSPDTFSEATNPVQFVPFL